MDYSHLDKKYFIDEHKFNCPFCRRNHVSYNISSVEIFDWDDKKTCFVYFVTCNSCAKKSAHFSFEDLRSYDYLERPLRQFRPGLDIDSKILFSMPSSFFVLDNRIPKKIRELVYEAEKSRQANLLTGASACLRKAIYELVDYEKCIQTNSANGKANYSESIKKLKTKFTYVSPELFDALGQTQELTSDIVHEGSWKSWDSKHLNMLVQLLKIVLDEMYVIPEEKKNGLKLISDLKKQIVIEKGLVTKDQKVKIQ